MPHFATMLLCAFMLVTLQSGEIDRSEDAAVLAAIAEAVAPTESQSEEIRRRLDVLRARQSEVLRQVRSERAAEGGRRESAVAAKLRAAELLAPDLQSFRDDCRALLDARQQESWDGVTGALELMPTVLQVGRVDRGPQVGDQAPDFDLRDLNGRQVTLRSLRGKPVVIEFGSYSWPMFRRQIAATRALRQAFRDDVHWVIIYTAEADTDDGSLLEENELVGIRLAPHETMQDRVKLAELTNKLFKPERPILLDTMDDATAHAYAGMPNRGIIVDAAGEIVSRQEAFDLVETRGVLRRVLANGGVAAPSTSTAGVGE